LEPEIQDQILDYLEDGKSANEIAKLLKDDENIKVSKATINRCRKLLTAFGDSNILTEREREVYLNYMEQRIAEKKSTGRNILNFFSPVIRTVIDGPVDPNIPEYSMQGHQNFLNSYTPMESFEPINVDVSSDGKINSAPTPFVAVRKSNGSVPSYPKYFWNPYTALDLLVFQDVYTHTICGTIIDILVNFSIGMGIKPVLKLIDENISDDKIKDKDVKRKDALGENKTTKVKETKQEAIIRIIAENKNLLDPLIAIDYYIGHLPKCPGITEDWNTKVEAFIRNHWVFGRDIMTMETNEKYVFEWKDKKYPKIRTVAKVQHPRDLNFIEIDQDTQTLKAVALMYSGEMVTKEEMIYLAHQSDSAIYNGKMYGYGKMQRMLGDGRSLRKLKDRDFPNVASIGYAPFTIVAMKRDKKGTLNENTQNQAFANTMIAGAPNFTTLNNPEKDLVVHKIDTDPKISEMIELAHYHAEAAAKTCQVPTTLVAKEKDPNRDTLLAVLRMFAETEIPRVRLPIKRVFSIQHYMVNWDEIYKDNEKVRKQFRVEAEFTDIKIDSWPDLIAAFLELNKLFRFTAEAAGIVLGIENLESKIDPEKEPLGEGGLDMGNGQKLQVTKPTKPTKPSKSS